MLDHNGPKYRGLLDAMGMPEGQRQEYLAVMEGLVGWALDRYFEELDGNGPAAARDGSGERQVTADPLQPGSSPQGAGPTP